MEEKDGERNAPSGTSSSSPLFCILFLLFSSQKVSLEKKIEKAQREGERERKRKKERERESWDNKRWREYE